MKKKILNKKDLILSKKLLLSYKGRLEKEIIHRSNRLRIPPQIFNEIINKNNEINALNKALKNLEGNPPFKEA